MYWKQTRNKSYILQRVVTEELITTKSLGYSMVKNFTIDQFLSIGYKFLSEFLHRFGKSRALVSVGIWIGRLFGTIANSYSRSMSSLALGIVSH